MPTHSAPIGGHPANIGPQPTRPSAPLTAQSYPGRSSPQIAWLLLYVIFVLLSPRHALAQPSHEFDPSNPANQYGLPDLGENLPPGDYDYCHWGNLMDESI